ncbi:MAG: heparan-alpha-glucosaminide N-acetyltransferase domain-containing protein [Polyangiales bacterium]
MIERHVALDRLRALAVVLMVQGHTFSALLDPRALPQPWADLHALVHGLTAPAFLLGAGLAFGVISYPRYAAHRRFGPETRARLLRYLRLLVLGYALQLPGASLLAAFHLHGDALAPVLRVGPLHLVALTLALCQLTMRVVPTARMHATLVLGVALAIVALAPPVHQSEAGMRAGVFVGPWLDASRGSLFPLFPWASYALFGVALGERVAAGSPCARDARALLASGLALAGGSYLLYRLGVRLASPPYFWHASPLNVAFRLGLTLCLFALLHVPRRAPAHGLVPLLARHSLVAYVAHLLLLYGTPYTPNLASRHGARLALPEATAACTAILLLTLAITYVGARLARGDPPLRGFVQAALALIGIAVILR